ncbi:MAG TPA: hypothetical protein VGB59_09525 [Allosphingosinicella sp.]|jgi:hypothetical protein
MSRLGTAIETDEHRAYLRGVAFAHLIRFLTILALALSPLAALGTGPASAMAHHAAMSADAPQMTSHQMAGHEMSGDTAMATMAHCKDMDGTSKDEPCRSADCLVACAAAVPAIPAISGALEPHAPEHGLVQEPALVSVPHGLVPEAATPPPRVLPKI